jgi:RecA-family ATPase
VRIEITEFANRKTSKGVVVEYSWEQLVDKLKHPVVTDESIDEYKAMTNEQRTEIKDVGGFVGGKMKGGIRRKSALESRTLLTIDADEATPHTVDDFLLLNDQVFCCHTTHTSTASNPRLRWVFPLLRPVTAEEYCALAREVATWVGVETIDETTDQPERLMFWPSIAFDADFGFWEGGRVILDPDEILRELDAPPSPTPIPQKEKHLNDGALSVPEGQRNKTVFSYAATLRGAGLDKDGIRFAISDYNERYCDPPLPESELDTIVRSICGRYEPGAAVMATLRDAWDDFNDLGEWVESAPKKIEHLQAESLRSLMQRDIEPPKFVVDRMITYGITILASPPKFGKSWMCLDMCISVATGTDFLGEKTNKDGVIYLALEDGDYRLQDRSSKVIENREIPDNMYLVKEAPALADGLLPQIKQLIDSTGGSIGLIVIDTLQKIRGVAGKTEGVYGYDYRELSQLHQFALDNNIAVVLVHHLNKGGDDSDFVSRLNGSTGISGAADTIITLTRAKRNDTETKMSITGRDIMSRTLILQFTKPNNRWIVLGEEQEVEKDRENLEFRNDPIAKTVIQRLNDADELSDEEIESVSWSCTSQELRDEVKRLFNEEYDSAQTVGYQVKKLVPKLLELEGITYEYRQVGKARTRTHIFTRERI